MKPSEGFCGLEEPAEPLPDFAKADMAVRPVGSEQDLWLPVQVKSTTRQAMRGNGIHWYFQKAGSYPSMVVVCVFHQESVLNPRTPLRECQSQLEFLKKTPKVWVFPGSHTSHLKSSLGVTRGGRHDREEFRCSFGRGEDSENAMLLGHKLLSFYKQSASGGGSSVKGVCLQSFKELKSQVSSTVETEEKTIRWFQTVFDVLGLEILKAPCWTLPYDRVGRLYIGDSSREIKLQIKTAYWKRWTASGPMAYVDCNRNTGVRVRQPYAARDFDFLFVGPPFNTSRLVQLHQENDKEREKRPEMMQDAVRTPYCFYMFCDSDLQRLEIVSSEVTLGKMGFELDFSDTPHCKHRSKPHQYLPWRYTMSATSLERAAQYFASQTSQRFMSSVAHRGLCTAARKRDNRSAADRMEVEHAAKRLIIQAIGPTPSFCGLEEPAIPLPHSAKADMALRPFGSKKDLWLPLQVKSTRMNRFEKRKTTTLCWDFGSVGGYDGMLVLCVSLNGGRYRRKEGMGVGDLGGSPRAWVFAGRQLTHLRKLRISAGGKHDTESSRCKFEESMDDTDATLVADCLLSAYKEAEASHQHTANGVCLRPLDYLRKQVSQEVQTEMETLSWFKEFLFSVAGAETKDVLCPTLPHDILVDFPPSNPDSEESTPLRIQLKTAYWSRGGRWGPVAHVNSYRRLSCRAYVPYTCGDFDIFLVGPPRNAERFLALKQVQKKELCADLPANPSIIPPFFYMFSSSDMQRLGLVSSEEQTQSGKPGFNLDFLLNRRHSTGSRTARLLHWRYDLSQESLDNAAQLLKQWQSTL
uniref:Uncharacterized protein n=1 Tax=Chromera velia CCMP2878 TaxID=1169474 RepID=A0A0G4HGN1_9ALVE|eukprot:Cvel_6747.t1-p1 / transcript=Cvel_6747.t1 / gene=Cvel_6747 / organism=Chromera_velia_CCMP2878 / gene_product=hypothetical protein / transcript_product=hypothetical protein / location=Cvel_scaffold337:93626-96040(+) / protein_length=805 / sequence_SO=supercontig / SO=protein_coding / is_pseudo=false